MHTGFYIIGLLIVLAIAASLKVRIMASPDSWQFHKTRNSVGFFKSAPWYLPLKPGVEPRHLTNYTQITVVNQSHRYNLYLTKQLKETHSWQLHKAKTSEECFTTESWILHTKKHKVGLYHEPRKGSLTSHIQIMMVNQERQYQLLFIRKPRKMVWEDPIEQAIFEKARQEEGLASKSSEVSPESEEEK